jgi:hypothetical protein
LKRQKYAIFQNGLDYGRFGGRLPARSKKDNGMTVAYPNI